MVYHLLYRYLSFRSFEEGPWIDPAGGDLRFGLDYRRDQNLRRSKQGVSIGRPGIKIRRADQRFFPNCTTPLNGEQEQKPGTWGECAWRSLRCEAFLNKHLLSMSYVPDTMPCAPQKNPTRQALPSWRQRGMQVHTTGMWKGQGGNSVYLTPELRREPLKGLCYSWSKMWLQGWDLGGWLHLKDQDKVDQKIIVIILTGVEPGRRKMPLVTTAEAEQGTVGLHTPGRRHG